MDPQFWLNRWRTSEIGWHEGRPNTMLEEHWPVLGLPRGARVFVPLCGKSVDLSWLAAQGHQVVGVELSEIAARDFFAEHGLTPQRSSRDRFEIWSAGGIDIWCGDLFDLQPDHLAGIDAVYDRASLIALSPELQARYAATMATLLPRGTPVLLVTFATDEAKRVGPPFSTSPQHVQDLFGRDFTIGELAHSVSDKFPPPLRHRGVTRVDEHALLLRRR